MGAIFRIDAFSGGRISKGLGGRLKAIEQGAKGEEDKKGLSLDRLFFPLSVHQVMILKTARVVKEFAL